jgi:hypothetical protein
MEFFRDIENDVSIYQGSYRIVELFDSFDCGKMQCPLEVVLEADIMLLPAEDAHHRQ